MRYNATYGQFITSSYKCGMEAVSRYIHSTMDWRAQPPKLTAGDIMIYCGKGLKIFFEVLSDCSLETLSDTTLVYYTPGSVVPTDARIPTLRFKDIRFPSTEELHYYDKCKTV